MSPIVHLMPLIIIIFNVLLLNRHTSQQQFLSISEHESYRNNWHNHSIANKLKQYHSLRNHRSTKNKRVSTQSTTNEDETAPEIDWSQNEKNGNVSNLLDQLLLGYDSHVRPNFGGPPIEVLIDIHIRSMGPVSEIDMTYVIDCYFRQTWTDQRLAYNMAMFRNSSPNGTAKTNVVDTYNNGKTQPEQTQKALALSINMLDRIWKPPTYFLNSRQSHMHTITLPNKFVRIYSNGRVLFSSRMTIKANCPMNLENFPMDTQRCPLTMGSFGYTSNDLIYNWNPNRKVVINPSMKMSQFDLIAVPVHSTNVTMLTASMNETYSALVATFHFKRHMGSFVIEVYAPCIMLVVLSWVGFWINREATADRVTLGLTTVLTMTFLGLELRNDLPKVPYLTSLDFFVYISFAFISATILEFGFVHFFTKIGSGEYYFMPTNDIGTEEEANEGTSLKSRKRNGIDCLSRSMDTMMANQSTNASVKRSASWTVASTNAQTVQTNLTGGRQNMHSYNSHDGHTRLSSFRNSLRNRLRQSFNRSNNIRRPYLTFDSKKMNDPVRESSIRVQLNSVSQIDRASRVIFPITFLIMNFVYWYIYLQAENNIDKQHWNQMMMDDV